MYFRGFRPTYLAGFFRLRENIDEYFVSYAQCSPGILGTTQREAAVVAAVSAERIVAAPELAGDLLIGRPAPSHQHDVEPGEATDGEKHQGDDAHDDHRDDRGHLKHKKYLKA